MMLAWYKMCGNMEKKTLTSVNKLATLGLGMIITNLNHPKINLMKVKQVSENKPNMGYGA
jgi:hypothetical protein